MSWNRLEWVFGWLWVYVCMYLWAVVSSSSITAAFPRNRGRWQSQTPLFTSLKRRLIFFHFDMFCVTKPVGVSVFPQRNSARLWFQCLPTESPKIRPSRSVSAYTLLGCLVDVCSPHTVCVWHYSVRKFSTLTISISIAPNTPNSQQHNPSYCHFLIKFWSNCLLIPKNEL